MNKLPLVILVIVFLGLWLGYTQEEKINTPAATISTQLKPETLNGILEEARRTEKPIFVYFRSDSCIWCKKFDAEVLPRREVQEKLEGFILAFVDVDKQGDLVKEFNIYGTPTMVFFDPEGRERTRILGYADTDKFLRVLEFASSASLSSVRELKRN